MDNFYVLGIVISAFVIVVMIANGEFDRHLISNGMAWTTMFQLAICLIWPVSAIVYLLVGLQKIFDSKGDKRWE